MGPEAKIDMQTITGSKGLEPSEAVSIRRRVLSDLRAQKELRQITAELETAANKARSKSLRNSRNLNLGICHWILGDLKEALKALEEAGSTAVSRYFQGIVLLEMKEFEEARRKFEASTRSSSLYLVSKLGVAECEINLGQVSTAIKGLNEVKQKGNESGDLHYLMGLALDLTGDYLGAEEEYNKVLEIDPENVKAIFRLAYNADLYGDEEEALRLYEKAVSIKPSYVNALVNLGELYEDLGEYTKATDCFKTVLRYQPNHLRAALFLKDARSSMHMYYDEEREKRADRQARLLATPVSDFELSVRSQTCLEKMNVKTLADLIRFTEADLLRHKNFGETSLNEIKQLLAQKGLRLGMGLTEGEEDERAKEEAARRELLRKPVSDLGLSVRCQRCMENLGANVLGDLVKKTPAELLATKNFGQISLKEVKEKLASVGLALSPEG